MRIGEDLIEDETAVAHLDTQVAQVRKSLGQQRYSSRLLIGGPAVALASPPASCGGEARHCKVPGLFLSRASAEH